jgi:hypothetical protein
VARREEIMPTPEGIISTSEGPVAPVEVTVEEAIEIIKEEDSELLERLKEADAEDATEEYK